MRRGIIFLLCAMFMLCPALSLMATDMPYDGSDNNGPYTDPEPTPDPGPDSTDSGDSWDNGSSGGGYDDGGVLF